MRKKLKTIFLLSGAGVILAPLFATIAFGYSPSGFVTAMVAGALITSMSAAVETFIFGTKFRRMKFSYVLIIRTMFYVTLISLSTIIVVIILESAEYQLRILDYVKGDEFSLFIQNKFMPVFFFSVIAVLTINFVWQMNTLLGKHVLMNYLTGRYHTPKEQFYVFMFLDLKSSTTIAESVDPLRYHHLLNEFFFDINGPIVESKGDIYQYVGDEVVIQWHIDDALKDANCIRCFFRICDVIEAKKEKYIEQFGWHPEFKAGMHCGKVVIGEVGDLKKEIVFHGDVMNTTSRIQSQCNTMKVSLLVSADLMKLVTVNHGLVIRSMGNIKLKGKQQEIELFSISRPKD